MDRDSDGSALKVAGFTGDLDFWRRSAFLSRPPSANAMYEWNRHARRRVKTDEYRDWQRGAVKVLRSEWADDPIAGPWQLVVFAAVNRKSDIDNLVKPTADTLVEAGMVDGDQWMDRVEVRRTTRLPEDTVIVAWAPYQDNPPPLHMPEE